MAAERQRSQTLQSTLTGTNNEPTAESIETGVSAIRSLYVVCYLHISIYGLGFGQKKS